MRADTEALLRELNPLAYPERRRLAARRARELAAAGALAPVVTDLYGSARFHRELAVFMATVGGHRPVIEAALTDPAWEVQRPALTAWLRSGPPSAETVAAFVAEASWHARRHVYRQVRRQRLTLLADGLIDAVGDRFGDAEAARLLPACSGAVVARLLPELGCAAGNWSRLGRLHPEACLSVAAAQLAGLSVPDQDEWWDRSRWLSAGGLPGALLSRLARLEAPELAPLARQLRRREAALVALLAAVPPARRAALYELAYADVDRGQARPDDAMLDVLPRAARWAEAERVLRLGRVRADDRFTLHYTAFRPWPQAREPLTAATRRAWAEDRAVGYQLLVASAGRSADPGAVTEMIEYLRRLRNEQDPVRSAALTALAQVRPVLLEPQAADALAQITADVLAARDSSYQTRQALTRLAITVLSQRSGSPPLLDWSLQTLQAIFGDHIPALGRIDTRLRRGQEHDFFAAVMQAGLTLWLADPRARARRVEEVLRADASAVVIPRVWAVLCGRRTDLLDQFLSGEPPRGKFIAAGVRWVPLHSPGTGRWLPRQQAVYAGLLARVAADAGARMHERTAAIAAAARAGDPGWDVVRRYLGSASTRLAEAALGALARAGRPGEALPLLLAHAGDDQARVAIYAASRVARFLPPGQLAPLLTAEPVAAGKVTARKEALRLAAALSVPGAGSILRQAWDRPGQHRDVRAAIAAAARQRLHDPASWPILEQAAAGPPEEAQAVIPAGGPLDCAPRYRRRYGELIIQVGRSTDQATATRAWQVLPGWAAWAPGAGALAASQLTDLENRVTWRLGTPTLLALLTTGQLDPRYARSPASSPAWTVTWPARMSRDATVPRGSA